MATLIAEITNKKCPKCGVEHSGTNSKCPACYADWSKAWRLKNRVKSTEICRAYRKRHPDRWRAYNRKYSLRTTYGITPEIYEQMMQAQGGACAICKTKTPSGPGKKLMVDHNHSTGEIRGLLCLHCNFVVGRSLENPAILLSAIAYLKVGK